MAPPLPAARAGCPNCDTPLPAGARFCPGCGQKVPRGRVSMRDIATEVWDVFVGKDRRVLAVARGLVTRPGGLAQDWIEGKRRRYVNPLALLLWTVGLAVAGVAVSGLKMFGTRDPGSAGIATYLQQHMNLVPLLQVPLLAALGMLFFGRKPWNFAEQLVLAAYATCTHFGVAVLVVVPSWIVFEVTELDPRLTHLYLGLWCVYFGWAASQFVPCRGWVNAAKGVAVAVLTHATTWFVIEKVAGVWFALGTS